MKRLLFPFIFLLLFSSFYFFVYLENTFFSLKEYPHLVEAQKLYEEGLDTKKIGKKEELLNHALTLYLDEINTQNLDLSNGKIYFNLANIFFHLEKYPLAIFYYQKAQQLRPRDIKVKTNLHQALKAQGIKPTSEDHHWQKFFFFHYKLSTAEKLQMLSIFVLATFITASIALWFFPFFQWFSWLFLAISIFLILSICYTSYIQPLQGVIIEPTNLYISPSKESEILNKEPLIGGESVEVIDVLENGTWLKVHLNNDLIGYIYYKKILLE